MMAEVEAKFLIENPAQIARLIENLRASGLDVQPLSPVEVVDRYLDTPDWQVFQAGWTYRWRDAGGCRKVGLKSATLTERSVQKREEVEQQVAEFPGNSDRVPTGQVAQRLNAVRPAKLHELFKVHNHRRLFSVRSAQGVLIELAIDHAAITATVPPKKGAPGRLEFEELEIELKEGTEESFQELAGTIEEQFGLLPSRLSKFERGLQAVGVCPPLAQMREDARRLEKADFVRKLYARPLRKKDPVVLLAYRCLIGQLKEMLYCEPRAWEGLDPEGVHRMRVATRRIRAAFRAFKNALPAKPVKDFNREFKWLAAVLGDVRDLDVYQDDFAHYAAEVPKEDGACLVDYRTHLTERRRQARRRLLACLSSWRYEELKQRFIGFLEAGPAPTALATADTRTIGEAARKVIRKQCKKVLRGGRAIRSNSPDEALHPLRISCKRLRYLFEFFHPIYGRRLASFIKRLKNLQDVLGEFQDACVATRQLREYADRVPMQTENRGQLIALGHLIQSQRRLAAEKRENFHNVWKSFDREGRQKDLRRLLSEG